MLSELSKVNHMPVITMKRLLRLLLCLWGTIGVTKCILMGDNTRTHSARITTEVLGDHQIQLLEWPVISADWKHLGNFMNKV